MPLEHGDLTFLLGERARTERHPIAAYTNLMKTDGRDKAGNKHDWRNEYKLIALKIEELHADVINSGVTNPYDYAKRSVFDCDLRIRGKQGEVYRFVGERAAYLDLNILRKWGEDAKSWRSTLPTLLGMSALENSKEWAEWLGQAIIEHVDEEYHKDEMENAHHRKDLCLKRLGIKSWIPERERDEEERSRRGPGPAGKKRKLMTREAEYEA